MKAPILALTLLAAALVPEAWSQNDEQIATFFQEIGVSPQVRFNSPGSGWVNTQTLSLFEVRLGTPAWQVLGLAPDTQPEPWPTPMEYRVTQLGRDAYSVLSRLSPGQRQVLRARLTRASPDRREIEELVRIIQTYIDPMRRVRDSSGTAQSELYPEDLSDFWEAARSVLTRIPEEEAAPGATGAAARAEPPAHSMEEVLRLARSRAQLQQGLLAGRQLLGSILDNSQGLLAAHAETRAAAGANEEEIRQLESSLQFLQWLNGPQTRQALRGDPARMRELQHVIEAINDITRPGGGNRTHRQEALYPLVQFIHESQLTERQWEDLISRFPMGESVNRMGWARLWRMGITGRMPDGSPMRIGVAGNGVDPRHPLLRGHVTLADNFTMERQIIPGSRAPVPQLTGGHETAAASEIVAALPHVQIVSYRNMLQDERAVPAWRQRGNLAQYVRSVVQTLAAARRDGVVAVNLSQSFPSGGSARFGDEGQDAINATHRQGIPVVVATGNDHPGTLNGLALTSVSVGSVDSHDRLSPFTSERDVIRTLPNGHIRLETNPHIVAPGEVAVALYDPAGRYSDPRRLYANREGTSYASPWVTAAMAALEQVAQRHGFTISPEEKLEILQTTGQRVDTRLHPLGIPALNPVAAVQELERRIAVRRQVQELQRLLSGVLRYFEPGS